MIAIDAMGGDFAPAAIVQGAFNAARRNISVALFGDQSQIESILSECAHTHSISWKNLPISIIHTTQIISMDQEPTRSVVANKDSSLVRAVQSVADGTCTAVLSAGNSGAAMVAGTFILGRTPRVLRPALGQFIPTKNGSIFCMDLGANTDCKPEFLEQFAYMGATYVSILKKIKYPRIALLSNGAEEGKGSQAVKKAFDIISRSSLHFIGNLESRDMFDDRADVLVCDGFTGNVLLKGLEGTTRAITHWIHQERKKSWLYSVGLWLCKGLFKQLKIKIDYDQSGGALLLGVNKPLIIAHGCATALSIEQSIMFAHSIHQQQIIEQFNTILPQALPTICPKIEFIPAQRMAEQEL